MNKKVKKYKIGMYGGKFMPFHKGHLYCVEQASKMCEKLYVILFVGGEQEIEILKTRHEKWLQRDDREKHIRKACKKFDNVEVIVIDTTKCKNPDGTENWDMETPLVLNACGKLDAVFGSEPDYGDYFKRAYTGAEYVQIDVERKSVPISATMIRNMKNSKEREKWII